MAKLKTSKKKKVGKKAGLKKKSVTTKKVKRALTKRRVSARRAGAKAIQKKKPLEPTPTQPFNIPVPEAEIHGHDQLNEIKPRANMNNPALSRPARRAAMQRGSAPIRRTQQGE